MRTSHCNCAHRDLRNAYSWDYSESAWGGILLCYRFYHFLWHTYFDIRFFLYAFVMRLLWSMDIKGLMYTFKWNVSYVYGFDWAVLCLCGQLAGIQYECRSVYSNSAGAYTVLVQERIQYQCRSVYSTSAIAYTGYRTYLHCRIALEPVLQDHVCQSATTMSQACQIMNNKNNAAAFR